jgi:hypothetical protein
MDFDFFFEFETSLGKVVMHIATNGQTDKRYLLLEVEDQEKLFDYFFNLKKSGFTISHGMKEKYPIITGFTDWAQVGVYSFDTDDGKLDLVASPNNAIVVEDLPADIRKLLTKY